MDKAWKCLVCGYIHFGDLPPEACPICSATKEEFEEGMGASKTETVSSENDGVSAELIQHLVVVGGGIAAVSTIEAVREENREMEITLISAEDILPYYRLNLSRYLAGEVTLEELTIHPEAWYGEKGIQVMLGTVVTGVDREGKTVVLSGGQRINYDKLVLAIGSHPFIPPFEGSHLDGVMTMRTVADANALLENKDKIKKCVAIGGGILGLEVAAALSKQGIGVTVLEGSPWLMPVQLNPAASSRVKTFLAMMGIEVVENARTTRIEGDADGKCTAVLLEDGRRFEADCVSLATGVRTNSYLARTCGLETDKGVIINNCIRTSDPDIYAPGDISEHFGTTYGLWTIAQYQGTIAGKNILGHKMQFGSVPRSNVVKVLGIDLFSIGQFMQIDGSYQPIELEEDGRYIHFMLHDNKLVGSIILGDKALALKVKKAVEKGVAMPMHQIRTVEDVLAYL